MAMDRLRVRIGHLDLVSGWSWLRCYPPVPLFCGRTSPTIVYFLLLILLLLTHRYAILWTEKRSVPCLQPIVEACGLKSTGGCEIPLRLDPSVRRMDLVPFNYVDRSIVGPQPETEGMGPVVSICNNGGVHLSPPLAPVVTIDSVASVVSASGVHNMMRVP